MQGNLIHTKNNTVERIWQFFDRIADRSWIAILLFTAAYLAAHGLAAVY